MRRGLVHVLAWLLATGAAVTLSWWGVHTVMAGTAYEPPRALPVTAADAATRRPRPPATKPPASPAVLPSPSGSPSSASPSPGPPAATPSRTTAPAASSTVAPGRVRAYDTDGGRAVFDLGTSGATLVSATPGTGWSMQVWKTTAWIRVEFARGADRVSVFCTWHDGPPRVEIGTY
ncbi:hypothetical protein D9753_22335 [Streptomyces dangxiongensis]|uniref:Secreted protein n=1 Tax=Streptomyces dangxiongensis TaxID=1442032 RepID=A0A3G2JFK0_9ACTN|nr:hypothetical protein [Streptomyces dangxiongensis]AYN41158.1 hypothetical protein D9753_22335 [Streptomyces dangxiongensis]